MFCKECGNQLDPEVTVCPNCGTDNSNAGIETAAEETATVESTAAAEETADMADDSVYVVNSVAEVVINEVDNKKQHKNNKKALWITLAAILGVIVCLAIVMVVKADALKSFYYRTFADPVKYHNYVVEQYVDHFAEFYGKSFETNKKFNEAFTTDGINANINFSVDEEVQNMLGQIAMMDMSWMDTATINLNSKTDDELVGVDLDLLLNDSSILSMVGIGSIEDNKGYYQFPTISSSYLLMDYEEFFALSGVDFTLKDVVSSAEVFSDVEAEELSRIIREYSAIVLENIQTVEKTKEELTVGEFTTPCTKLDVTLSEKDLVKIQLALVEKFKNDEELKKLTKDYCDYMDKLEGGSNPVGSTYDILVDSLDRWYDVTAGSEEFQTEDPAVKYSLWINKKGEIVGTGFYSLEDEEYVLEIYNLEEKNITASEILASDKFKMTGTATEEANLINASYTIAVEGHDALLLDVKDFDVNAIKDGYVKGTYQIKPTKELLNEVAPQMPSSLVSDVALEMAVDYSQDNYSLNTAIVNGDVKWLSMDVTVKPSSETTFQIPASSEKIIEFDPNDQAVVFEYLKTCDLDRLVNNLEKAKLPAEFVDAVKMQVEQIKMYLEYMDM